MAKKLTKAQLAKLPALIALIETFHNVPADQLDAAVKQLRKDHKAKITDKGLFWRVSMCGITATATAGRAFALSNWAAAARRKLKDET